MARKRDDGSFEFDPSVRRYRDRKSGQFVPRSEVDKAVGRAIEAGMVDINALSRRLQAGTLDVGAWQAAMAAAIKRSHIVGVIAAAGGRANVSKADWGDMGARLRGQYKYLRNFAKQIEAGEVVLDGRFLARAEMYGRSSSLSYNAVQRRHDAAAGYTEERRVLNSEHPCEDCPRYAALGWRPIGTIPLPTQGCQCLTNCKCSMERRRPDAVPAQVKDAPRFGPSTAAVSVSEKSSEQAVLKLAAKLARKKVTLQDLASLCGATNDSTVLVSPGNDVIHMNAKSNKYYNIRALRRSPDQSKLVLHNLSFRVDAPSRAKGLGTEIFGRAVEACVKVGVAEIRTNALRNPTAAGYKVWPRFGFDAPLPGSILKRLKNAPEAIKSSKRVSDLMRTPQGRAFWDQHGQTMEMVFDMAPGSLSRRIWDAYLASKQKKGKGKGK